MELLNYVEEYQHKTDDELLRIASAIDQLVPEAKDALKVEIARRGLNQNRQPELQAQKNKVRRIVDKIKRRSNRLLRPTKRTAATFAGWYVIAFVIFRFDISRHGVSFQHPMPVGYRL